MALKSWAEASASPQYQNATPEQQAQMREQFKAAGGNIPEEQTTPQQPQREQGVVRDVAEGVGNFLQSGGANISHSAARGLGGLVEMGERITGSNTSYGKRIQQNAEDLYQKRMSGIEEGVGKTAGNYAGVAADIGMTVYNPLAAAGVIAGRETGRAYADQTPAEGEDKSLLNAGLVGAANYAAQRILPGMTGTAETALGRIGQSVTQNAIAGAKGGAAVGAAEALNKYGDDTNLTDLAEGAIEGGATGAAYGGTIGGVHGIITAKNPPKVFKNTPENVKTDVAAETEAVQRASTPEDLRAAYDEAANTNTASALNLLDSNDFRLTDAVALDHPQAQRILGTDQARAEKAATSVEEASNIPGMPWERQNRAQGKANADNEHNQKQAVSMKNAMDDYTKDNIKSLNDVLDGVDARLNEARVKGDFAGGASDIKAATQADRDFIEAYKQFANESSNFRNRSGEDLTNFLDKATELQKRFDDISPEMQQAVQNLKKIKGLPEGFNPIQDAHVLNETSRLMSNQDRNWTTLSARGFDEAAAPSLTKNPLGAAKYALSRFTAGRARSERARQQESNRAAIQDLARSDLAVAQSRRNLESARDNMENPPEDPIPFETSQATPEPTVTETPAPETRTPMRPDGVETPLQRYQREQEAKAAAAQQAAQVDVNPEPRGLTAAELARAPRRPEPVVEEPTPTPEPTPEPAPEPIPEAPEPRQLTAAELAEAGRRVKETRKAAEPEPTPEPAPEPTPEPTPETATTARELVEARRQARQANKELEAKREAERRAKEEQEAQQKAPETPPETSTPKSEPLPSRAPKTAEKAPEPVKPAEGSDKLAALSTHERTAVKSRAERFARSLYSAAAKAKATAENFLAYRGDPKELMRRIRQEDQANNAQRHEEMAKNQLASQQGIASAKSTHVRNSFADWVKDRGLPERIATQALKAEEKGMNGNVTSLDALKRRAERLYQKQLDEDFNRLFEEAKREDSVRFPGEKGPTLTDQKSDMLKEIDTLLKDEPLSPAQKAAIKERMTDLVNTKFKSSEKAGREEGLETGQMRDIWETFTNTYKKEADIFNKANKNSQYEATAKHLEERTKRLDELRQKAAARAKVKEQAAVDRQQLEAITAQKKEIDDMMKKLPEEVRKSQEARTLSQLSAHHDKGSPVPPERFRGILERIHNKENDFYERQQRLSDAEEEARQLKWNRMYEQAQEMNRRYDVEKRSKAEAAQEAELKKQNDYMAVQRQRDDIHSRVMQALEDKGITGKDAESFAGAYMDNRYALLESPMTATEHQNARARIENDVDKFAKKYEAMSPIEREIARVTGGEEANAKNVGEEGVKAVEEARKVDAQVEALRKEELEMQKVRAALPDGERAQADADIKEAIQKQESDFVGKVERAFKAGRNLDELASVAEILDRVHGADTVGNNRRFVDALKTAADNKREFGNNPIAWFSSEDYSSIAKLGSSSAGGNKTRALEKIFGTTSDQAKAKLLGTDDVAKMRRVIKANPDTTIPSYKTTTRQGYMEFLEKFNEDGTPKVKRGSLSERIERSRRQSQVRLRVKPKS